MRQRTALSILVGCAAAATTAAGTVAVAGPDAGAPAPVARAGTCYAEVNTIRDIPFEAGKVWETHDANDLLRWPTRDASMIVPGEDTFLRSRREIGSYLRRVLNGPGKDVVGTDGHVMDVRCLTRDVGLVVTQAGLLLEGETEPPPERVGRQSYVIVKHHDEWLIDHYQNSRLTGQCPDLECRTR